ncbi:hypothetical protein GUJ93_ZPchr0010g11178 [Zizania palustris]|uniref:Uncharacterized protein n=1 Tax=Zizania palustris TaxID=103762 RepID=A0A8J6BRS0_ZIZPA|nr:hypothetical protein GUJ93_ZPchr0010g11178 [Zizania palustris]
MQGMKGRDEVIDLPSDEEGQIQMAIRNSLRDKNLSRVIERRHGSGSGVRVSLGKKISLPILIKSWHTTKYPCSLELTLLF